MYLMVSCVSIFRLPLSKTSVAEIKVQQELVTSYIDELQEVRFVIKQYFATDVILIYFKFNYFRERLKQIIEMMESSNSSSGK